MNLIRGCPNDHFNYSDVWPDIRGTRASPEKPLDPSGPFGCRTTINLGPVSSTEMVRKRLISLSGLACTSLKTITIQTFNTASSILPTKLLAATFPSIMQKTSQIYIYLFLGANATAVDNYKIK